MPHSPIQRSVLKFGGAALADGAGVRRVCELVSRHGGPRPIVVVSAAWGVTALLEGLWRTAAGLDAPPPEGDSGARGVRIRHRSLLSELGLDAEFLDRHLRELNWLLAAIRGRAAPSPADRDHVLSFGERMSARIVAASLTRAGSAATPVDAFDLGLVSDSNHGRARPLPENAARVARALEGVHGIPVVTGFVAVDAFGQLTTLGRNGSDLTASLVGVAVGASEVRFWKSVGGVLTADPVLVPGAFPIRALDYERAAEFARAGADVLHPEALEPLRIHGIVARVQCFHDPEDPGTRIEHLPLAPATPGIACSRDWVELTGPSKLVDELRLEQSERSQGRSFAPWSDEFARASAAVGFTRGFARIAVLHAAGDSAAARCLARAGITAHAHAERGPAEFLIVARHDLEHAARSLHADLIESKATAEAQRAASA